MRLIVYARRRSQEGHEFPFQQFNAKAYCNIISQVEKEV